MAFCSNCGTQVTEGTKFCQNCGNDVSGSSNGQQMNTASSNNQQSGYTQADNQQGNNQGNFSQGNYNQDHYNQGNYNQQNHGSNMPSFMNTADTTNQYSMDDINQNKVMALIAYLGILWLIPFFGAKHSPFAKYHVKQAFLLICSEVLWWIISFFINFGYRNSVRLTSSFNISFGTPWIITMILWIVNLILLAFTVIGVINAVQGRAKELPLIGKAAKNFTFLD